MLSCDRRTVQLRQSKLALQLNTLVSTHLVLTNLLLLRNPRAALTTVPESDETDGVTFPAELGLPDAFSLEVRRQHQALEQIRRHQQTRLEAVACGLNSCRR